MAALLEPVFAGIVVALFNKYILGKFDALAVCSTACVRKHDDRRLLALP